MESPQQRIPLFFLSFLQRFAQHFQAMLLHPRYIAPRLLETMGP